MDEISAVIFDCDGVLFDSRQSNVSFYNHLLNHFGLKPMDQEEEAFVHMHTAAESVRHIFRATPFVHEAQAYRLNVDYTPFITQMLIEPGLTELLNLLKPHYRLAVATNRSNTIEQVLRLNRLEVFFDLVISSLDVKNAKPHPEALHKILEFFQLRPQQSLYVGDSLVDSQTAEAAGVPFISYKNRGLKASYHAESLLEIGEILGAENRL
jgi:phosphoglycolate phosphatase